MKTLKFLVSVIVAILASIYSFAAPNSLPIQGEDVARLYNINSVAHGFRDVVSKSLIRIDGQDTWTEASGKGAEDVMNKLFSTEIKYKLGNPLDKINGRVWLYDNNYNLLFFGSAEYFADSIGGKGGGPAYRLWMQEVILPVENVQSGEVLALSEDGRTAKTYDVDVDKDGHVHFSWWMAGAPNGILSLRFKDGSVLTYNLWEPVAETPIGINESQASWKIDGHHVFPASEKDTLLVSITEVWTRPTAKISVKADQSVKFDVMGLVEKDGNKFFERPTAISWAEVDGPRTGSISMLNNEPTVAKLPFVGNFHLKFDWVEFGKPNTIYTGPDWDDEEVGKGVVEDPIK